MSTDERGRGVGMEKSGMENCGEREREGRESAEEGSKMHGNCALSAPEVNLPSPSIDTVNVCVHKVTVK